eukprot:TRINITY_DN6139_c0_g1_i2.p1 TRINITY_DN6139_c0_g1~~TRINITY_DN6139_c0_g1_i2.p1  ORF type:complete len:329 (+),score=96.38 TRINITY_DN6139_c0_g1_i2:133-987(+)
MAVTRMHQQQNKKRNLVANLRREIATLMANGKCENARIKCEVALRDEYYQEALDVVVLFCQLLTTRQLLFCESTTCPLDLNESLQTVVWATSRTEGIQELQAVRHQVAVKFGKDWVDIAMQDRENAVNARVKEKLSVTIPAPERCLAYLQGICDEFNLDWEPVSASLAASDLIPASAGVYRDGKVDTSFTPPPTTPPANPPGPPPPAAPRGGYGGGGGYVPPPANPGPLGPPPSAEFPSFDPAPQPPATAAAPAPKDAAPCPPPQPPADDDDDLEARLDRLKRL